MLNYESWIARAEDIAVEKPAPVANIMDCIDLTNLDANAEFADIQHLCAKARAHEVAAICVYPMYVATAVENLKGSDIAIATVANFPDGKDDIATVLLTIEKALQDGATEIDVVIPYHEFITTGDQAYLKQFVQKCKKLVANKRLKVILESGVFPDVFCLETACLTCLEGGADFLKTSTGKVPQGASLLSAAVMLHTIKTFADPSRGLKVSGGIKYYAQAKQYYALASLFFDQKSLNKKCFRIGASSLIDDLLHFKH